MSIIWTILIGFVVGLVATFLMPGRQNFGFIWTSCLGIGGAMLATFLGQFLGFYKTGDFAGFIASVIGAILLLIIWGAVQKKR